MTSNSVAFAERFDVSRETLRRLEAYYQLLLKWNPRINLVSPRSVADAWRRHFWDSAQIFELRPDNASNWIDLGSGGGFPGAVVAIMAKEMAPDLNVTLVESDQRKCVFMRTVARETDTPMNVVADRIEATRLGKADVLSARALAPLTDLLGLTETRLASGGIALFPKGKTYRDELSAALESWTFDCETYPSETDPDSVILKVEDIGRG